MTKILVIEDEFFIRENLLELLEAENFDCIGAENGLQGVELAKQHLPDLILCDVLMPALDGFGVLATLRENPATATIPFIFLTAKSDLSDIRQGMELGADDYLAKPCSAEQLLKAISTRLQKYLALKQPWLMEKTRLVSALQRASEQLNNLLYSDRVTNLPNRFSLRDRFQEALQTWGILPEPLVEDLIKPSCLISTIVPLFYLGLNRFKRINDSLGYDVGDLLLKAVADRLKDSIAGQGIIAHINNDEFAIIYPPVEQKREAAQLAQTLQEQLAAPFLLAGQEVFITASMGIALYPFDGQEIEALLQNAKKAMERAKQTGSKGLEFYTAAFNIGTSNWLSLEVDLRHALEREELLLHYQPKVSIETGEILGCEALLRWHHPVRGAISPAKFIPLAEETGLIESIGEWVLRTACQQLKTWQGDGLGSLRVAVNLSGRQFNQIDLRQRIIEILVSTGLEPQYLELEITESSLVQNPELANRRLNSLKNLGLQIAIDDFGTGYSSLSYLQQFPFDILKIDQCFVRNLAVDAKNTAITTAIIAMAHQMNLRLVAEGVETKVELDFLRSQRCDEMQGYLFSRPLSAAEFEQLVRQGTKLDLE